MEKLKKGDYLLMGLAFLALAQLSVLAARWGSAAERAPAWFSAGDTLPVVTGYDSAGGGVPLANGERTVLLVFRSDCAHSGTVAPVWRDWLAEAGEDLRVVAVAAEDHSSAQAFAARQQWSVEVLTVADAPPGSPEHVLTARTPWIFVLDEAGTVLAEGHGATVADLVSSHPSTRGSEYAP